VGNCPLNDNLNIKEWKKKSEKACGQILGAVSRQYAKLTYIALDAHTAWVALKIDSTKIHQQLQFPSSEKPLYG
jgi:hypothetical protein